MLEENHDLEKIIEDAKQYRWYSVPDMYVVEILDTTGRSAGFVQSIFIDKKEASEVAKVLHGVLSGDGYFSDQANIQYKEINRMIESFKDLWDCVEKVNAHLVVED